MIRRKLPAIALACSALMVVPAQAITKFSATTTAASGTINLPGPTDYHSDYSDTGVMTFTSNSTQLENAGSAQVGSVGTAASHSTAVSGPGGLSLYADATAALSYWNGGAMSALATGSANGSIDDSFIISAVGCSTPALCGTGAYGVLTFSVLVNGSLGGSGTYNNASWTVNGSWASGMNVGTGLDNLSGQWSESLYDNSVNGPISSSSGGFGVKTFTANFVFGQAISVHLDGSVIASASVGYGGTTGNANSGFVTDLSHTIGWGGISSLKDANGNTIAFSALNSGGSFDYANAFVSAVPEPSQPLMLLAGMATLGLLVRRRLTASF